MRLPFVTVLITLNPTPAIFYPLSFHNTMIFFTTFIFTLLLVHIARAMPACGDVASFEDMYDPMYDEEQLFPPLTKVTWDDKYDNLYGATTSVACKHLTSKYPHFHDLPGFPYIGGAFDITGPDSPNCGKCWKLTDPRTHKFIYFTAMDTSKPGFSFVLSKHAFMALSGGPVVPPTLEVDFQVVPRHFCGFKS